MIRKPRSTANRFATGGSIHQTSKTPALRHILIGGALAIGTVGTAVAQTAPATTDNWMFEASPYLWMAGTKFDSTIGNLPTTHVNWSFSDVLKDLKMAAMGQAEARKGRWGFLFDGFYIKMSDGADTTRLGPAGNPLTASADISIKQSIIQTAIAYRVMDEGTTVDLVGGNRYNKITVGGTFDLVSLGLTGAASRKGNVDWNDAFAGVRVRRPINERWTMTGYVDAGGSSSVSADVGARYAYSKDTTINMGWRYYDFDYKNATVQQNQSLNGPYLGASFRF